MFLSQDLFDIGMDLNNLIAIDICIMLVFCIII